MSRARRISRSVVLLAAVTLPRSLHAQFEGFLSSMHDIRVAGTCWSLTGGASLEGCGSGAAFGVEVIWRVNESVACIARSSRHFRCPSGQKTRKLIPDDEQVSRIVRRDSVGAVISIDTVTKLKPEEKDDSAWWWIVDVGLGYSQFTGLRAATRAISLDGSAREFPALSVYTTLWHSKRRLSYFAGARTGFVELHQAQATAFPLADPATIYQGSARALQLGAVGGIDMRLLGDFLYSFTEVGYMHRRFPTIDWKSGASATLPGAIPRSMNLSGVVMSVGLQFVLDRE
jgi:hypothetical protein